jgi:hypothetical protein
MGKTLIVAIVFVFGLAGSWWVARLTAAPFPGPPVSSPITRAQL